MTYRSVAVDLPKDRRARVAYRVGRYLRLARLSAGPYGPHPGWVSVTLPARCFGFDGQPIARVTAQRNVLGWLAELVEPALAARDGSGGWEVDVLEWSEQAPAFPPPTTAVYPLACFVLDRSTLSLPAWRDAQGFVVSDPERGCHFMIRAGRITLAPHTLPGRRWRYTLAMILYELVAARARRHQLELHSAAVESHGRGMLAIGPKRAGKTTLALHLQRRGACRAIANDRVFVSLGDDCLTAHGLPTVVKIRPATAHGLPELQRDRPWVERSYLYSVAELSHARGVWPEDQELMLTPAQVAARLGSERGAGAPIEALMFPAVDPTAHGVSITRLPAEMVSTMIDDNRFGQRGRARGVFEALDARRCAPSQTLVTALSRVPAYCVVLGAGAYQDRHFSQRIVGALGIA